MGTSKVFQSARAVLSPQFLSHIPSDIDCEVLLWQVTDGLQLGLTTDLTTGISCLALQGKWEDIIRAEIKLTELLTKWQEEKCNDNSSSCVETCSKSGPDNINLLDTNKLIKFKDIAELPNEVPKDPVKKVHQSSETKFAKKLPDNSSDEIKSSQKDSVVNVIPKEGRLNKDVRKVIVISNDCIPFDILPSLTCDIPSNPQGTSNSSEEAEKISVPIDSSSQLIIVTNSVEDSETENITTQNDKKGEEELHMNIVLSSKKENNASLSDNDLKETLKKSGSKENPLDKLCQLLKIEEEEETMAPEIIDKRHNEFERRRRYENNMAYKYFCTKCSFKTKRENQYLRHVKFHEEHKVIYHCSGCQFKTIRIGTLRRHELQHNENRIIVCAKCPYKTDSLELLKKHIHSKHPSNKSPYQCDQCDYKVDSLRLLRRHRYEYHIVKPQTLYSCSLCPYKTKNKGHMLRHNNDVHESIRSYLCHHCGKSFKRHDSLRQHKIIHGETGPSYPCSKCDKVCNSAARLKVHMSVHTALRPFLCELCGSTFKTLSTQRKHVKIIHDANRFTPCPQCKRIFRNKISMARHQKIHCSKKNTAAGNTASKPVSVGNSYSPNEENRVKVENIY